jgi:hypothetical protein
MIYPLSAPTVGDSVGARPPAAAAVRLGVVEDAVRSFAFSALCATAAVAAAVPPLKLIRVPVPSGVPSTVANDPSGAALKPPNVIVIDPVKLDRF